LVIANYHKFQKIKLSENELDKVDLIIFDEGHHAEAKTYVKIRNHFKSARCVYLSATPFHSDEFEKSFKYVYKEEFKEMCQNNIIRDFKLITVPGEVPKRMSVLTLRKKLYL
jgi:DNA repair protein RadD